MKRGAGGGESELISPQEKLPSKSSALLGLSDKITV